MIGIFKLLLAAVVLLAQLPLCKAVGGCAHSHIAHSESEPADESDSPASPDDCQCPLCSPPVAALFEAAADLPDSPAAEFVTAFAPLASPDGFHLLLDRPPRA